MRYAATNPKKQKATSFDSNNNRNYCANQMTYSSCQKQAWGMSIIGVQLKRDIFFRKTAKLNPGHLVSLTSQLTGCLGCLFKILTKHLGKYKVSTNSTLGSSCIHFVYQVILLYVSNLAQWLRSKITTCKLDIEDTEVGRNKQKIALN